MQWGNKGNIKKYVDVVKIAIKNFLDRKKKHVIRLKSE